MIDHVLAPWACGPAPSWDKNTIAAVCAEDQNVDLPQDSRTYSYEDFLGLNFKVVRGADAATSTMRRTNIWKDKSEDSDYMKQLVAGGEDLTIVGIVQPKADASAADVSGIASPCRPDAACSSRRPRPAPSFSSRLADPTTNVLTGEPFGGMREGSGVNSLGISPRSSLWIPTPSNTRSPLIPAPWNFDLDGAFRPERRGVRRSPLS